MKCVKPKHEQLYEILREEFDYGEHPEGTRLPTTGELAKRHRVSVNVAGKAVELLKRDNLVSTHPRSGIFSSHGQRKVSQFNLQHLKNISFPKVGRLKLLSVRVEDRSDWKRPFWEKFFQEFSADNQDIQLNAIYDKPREGQSTHIDLLIGGAHFFNSMGGSIDDFHTDELIGQFHPDMYDDSIIIPQDLAWKSRRVSFPMGFVLPVLLDGGSEGDASSDKDMIGMLKRLTSPSGATYKYWSLNTLLANCGVSFFDPSKGVFALKNRRRLLGILDTLKELAKTNKLLASSLEDIEGSNLQSLHAEPPARLSKSP